MTKQLTPLRRKDQATGYAQAVKEIVAWIRENDVYGEWREGAATIEAKFGAKFGGDNGQRHED